MLSDLLILLPALLVFVYLVWPRRGETPVHHPETPVDSETSVDPETPPDNAIVVDGSNVMYWGGGDASAKVLSLVLRSLEKHGLSPIVFFDANVGYILGDHYFDELRLARLTSVSKDHICVVNKGVIADEMILAFSADHGLRIVTNDQYRDWRVQFPHIAKKGQLVKGAFVEGAVRWRGTL